MSKQRDRHLRRQPAEEFVRQLVSDLVGNAGDVDVERHSHDTRPDDLLISVRLHQPITGNVLAHFRRQIGEKLNQSLSSGQECDGWLVVVECGAETLCTVTWRDILREADAS